MNPIKIAVVARKGGAGKTTTVMHMAQILQKAGHDVAILDLDPEISAVSWAKAGSLDFPVYTSFDRRKAEKHQILLIDTPPNSPKSVGEAARMATHVVVVAGSNAMELDRLVPTLESLASSGYEGPWGVVLSRTKGKDATEAAIKVLEDEEIPVFGVVPNNTAFEDAFRAQPKRLKEYRQILHSLGVM